MKSVRPISLPIVGMLVLAFGSHAIAGETAEPAPLAPPAGVSAHDSDRPLVDLFMADDQNELVDTLAGLESSLRKAEFAREDAALLAQEAGIEEAGALAAFIGTENAVATTQRVHDEAARALAAAKAEREAVAALEASQENNSEIDFIDSEIARLRQQLQLAAEDLYRAENRFEAARYRLAAAEKAVAPTERDEMTARRQVASIEGRIAAAHTQFDAERARVVAVVAELSAVQRSALQRSLGSLVKDQFVAVNIDASHLRRVVDNAYNPAQIRLLAKALRVDAEFRQFAVLTGNSTLRNKVEREKARYMAEIDRLEAEKYDEQLGGRSAFGVASHPSGDTPEKKK